MRRIAVFVYGSLLAPEVICAVIGRRPAYRDALLHGYRRCALRIRRFPGLLADAGAQTRGALIAVSPRELLRLDRYEDDFYHRRSLRVRCDGSLVLAQVYVLQPRCRRYAAARPWQPPRYAASAARPISQAAPP